MLRMCFDVEAGWEGLRAGVIVRVYVWFVVCGLWFVIRGVIED